ncbi:hypothetical protein M0805_001702 [Coniferiporia weirii]|nr:hypothetical protein M0805_001702 [Coniferiporia weirii]
MSDARYPPHAHAVPHAHHYSADSYAYTSAGLANGHHSHHSQRQPAPYAHAHAVREADSRPSHSPSYPAGAGAYPMPQRSVTPSLAGHHPQLGFPPGSSRHRTSSISAAQAAAQGHYAHAQSPPMPSSNGLHRPQSHLHASQLAATTQHTGYMDPHSLVNPVDYMHRSATPVTPSPADYCYGQDGQMSSSSQRPFPCDMCALSFNRQHDLKRHRDTHSGERPFLCNGGCGKTFTRKDALKRHQLVKSCGRTED